MQSAYYGFGGEHLCSESTTINTPQPITPPTSSVALVVSGSGISLGSLRFPEVQPSNKRETTKVLSRNLFMSYCSLSSSSLRRSLESQRGTKVNIAIAIEFGVGLFVSRSNIE